MKTINDKYIFPLISDYNLSLPLCIMTIGKEVKPNSIHTLRPNGIPHHQFLFIASGKAEFVFNNTLFTAPAGSFIYHSPHTPHDYYAVSKSWTSYWLTFSVNCSQLLELKNGVYKLRDSEIFINLVKQMINLQNDLSFIEKSSVLLYDMILKLKRSLSDNIPNDAYSLLRTSVNYMHNHFSEDVPLQQLANMSGVTPGYYCKIFKDCYHMRPLEYIQKLRIQKAKTLLLQNPSLSIAQISDMVGYTSSSYFIKHFKKLENITPSEFRKK